MAKKNKKLSPIKVVTNNDVLVEGFEAIAVRQKERELLAQKISLVEPALEEKKEEAAPIMMSVEALWDGSEVNKLNPQEKPLWDLDLLKVPYLWAHYGTRGQGVTVHVVDSGVNSLHPAFAGKKIFAQSFIDDDCSDHTGHGTWVAGKIAGSGIGIAPQATLKCARVLDNSGVGSSNFTNRALASVLNDDDADIVNLSLGSPARCHEQERLIWQLHRRGILIVAAAGNRGSSTALFPAAFDGVITVGALDHKEARASFSNFGATLEIVAPGVSCYGPCLGTSYKKLQGTSMAAPVVTGILTLALAYLKTVKPEMSRIERRNSVVEALKVSAKDLGPVGWDKEYGFGGLNAVGLFENLKIFS